VSVIPHVASASAAALFTVSSSLSVVFRFGFPSMAPVLSSVACASAWALAHSRPRQEGGSASFLDAFPAVGAIASTIPSRLRKPHALQAPRERCALRSRLTAGLPARAAGVGAARSRGTTSASNL